jgi:excisionase family DNA binding protein
MSTKPEYLSKALAAARLGLSVRRVLELSKDGRIGRRRERDPKTGREQAVFLRSDIERLAARSQALSAPAAAKGRLALPSAFPSALPAEETPPWMTTDEAARHSGLPASFLVRMIEAGRLAALDVGRRPGGRWRINRADLDAIRGETVAAPLKLRAKKKRKRPNGTVHSRNVRAK